MNPTTNNSFVAVSDSFLVAKIVLAQERLVFVAPGLSEPVADAVALAWQKLGPDGVSVIVDVDPEICRLGYGTKEGLVKLQQAAVQYGAIICEEPGVRIGLLITDDMTMLYSPTPLLIEAERDKTDQTRGRQDTLFQEVQPNGIILKSVPAEIAKDVGLGERRHEDQTIGLDQVKTEKVSRVVKELEENPPAKFDLARKIRVFTQRFQFIEFSLEDCFISQKTVCLPNELLGLLKKEKLRQQLQNRVKTTYKLIGEADLEFAVKGDSGKSQKTKVSEKLLRRARADINRNYLTHLRNYGAVILKSNQASFDTDVGKLSDLVTLFKSAVQNKVGKIIHKNREAVLKWLLPIVLKNPPPILTKIHGSKPNREVVRQYLAETLAEVFGTPADLVAEMKVSVVRKDVTWESLNNPDFIATAKKAMPTLEHLFDEIKAVEAKNPNSKQPVVGKAVR